MYEFMFLLLILPFSAVGIFYYGRWQNNKRYEDFQIKFTKEEAEREMKVRQAKYEGTLNIDKLIEIYYPEKKSSVFSRRKNSGVYLR